jgi:hypothetical protein
MFLKITNKTEKGKKMEKIEFASDVMNQQDWENLALLIRKTEKSFPKGNFVHEHFAYKYQLDEILIGILPALQALQAKSIGRKLGLKFDCWACGLGGLNLEININELAIKIIFQFYDHWQTPGYHTPDDVFLEIERTLAAAMKTIKSLKSD